MPITFTDSDYNTVTVASQELPIAMVPGFQYVLRSNVALYYKVGPTGTTTAAAADNSHYLAAGMPAYVAARGTSTRVAVIRETADGICTLSRMEPSQP